MCVVVCAVVCCVLCVLSQFLPDPPSRPSDNLLPPSSGPPPSAEPHKISLFFSFAHPTFAPFVSLWVSLNFGGVCEDRDPQLSRFGSRVVVRPPSGLWVPAFSTHHNSTRRPPREKQEEQKWGWRGEKSAKIRASPPSGPHRLLNHGNTNFGQKWSGQKLIGQ